MAVISSYYAFPGYLATVRDLTATLHVERILAKHESDAMVQSLVAQYVGFGLE